MMISLQQADVEDAPCIWEMQKTAFQKLLLKYEDYDTNPAREPLENIGAVSVTDREDGSAKRLAPIFLLPQFEGRGYGQTVIREVERIHGVHGWELDTIAQEDKLCYLYEKMGYIQTGEKIPVNENMTLVLYKKI